MTEKELRSLSKLELLEMMRRQELDIENLNTEKDVPVLQPEGQRPISGQVGDIAPAEKAGIGTPAAQERPGGISGQVGMGVPAAQERPVGISGQVGDIAPAAQERPGGISGQAGMGVPAVQERPGGISGQAGIGAPAAQERPVGMSGQVGDIAPAGQIGMGAPSGQIEPEAPAVQEKPLGIIGQTLGAGQQMTAAPAERAEQERPADAFVQSRPAAAVERKGAPAAPEQGDGVTESSLVFGSVMKAAQAAAGVYLENIKKLEAEKEAIVEELKQDQKEMAAHIYSEAERRRAEAEEETKRILAETKLFLDQQIEQLTKMRDGFMESVQKLGIYGTAASGSAEPAGDREQGNRFKYMF